MPVLYMDRASIESLTEKDIRDIIDENSMDLKYGKLYEYYKGKHRILEKAKGIPPIPTTAWSPTWPGISRIRPWGTLWGSR